MIYGYNYSYDELLLKSSLMKMEDRRIELFKKFTIKTSENERYSSWFPFKENLRETRKLRPYLEQKAKSERLYRSPLFAMRRLLNDKDPVKIDPKDLTGTFNKP